MTTTSLQLIFSVTCYLRSESPAQFYFSLEQPFLVYSVTRCHLSIFGSLASSHQRCIIGNWKKIICSLDLKVYFLVPFCDLQEMSKISYSAFHTLASGRKLTTMLCKTQMQESVPRWLLIEIRIV